MPEYSDENVKKWMNASRRVYDTIGPWNEANLVSRNRGLQYMQDILSSANEIPEKLRDEELREKISVLEEAIKLVKEKNEFLANI